MQWLRDQLGIISGAAQSESLARQVDDNGGVYFVPAFSGLFAPYWRSDARGAIVGLSRFNTNAHLARATLEAICYQSRDVVDAMEADSGVHLEVLKVDGGITANDLCMQIQADVLGVDVVKPVVAETTALGAAYAAGPGRRVLGEPRRAAGQLAGGQALDVRTGLRTSAPPATRAGRRPCSARWTGSTSSDFGVVSCAHRGLSRRNRNQAARRRAACLVSSSSSMSATAVFSSRCCHRRRAGDQQHVRRDRQRPRECDLRRGAAELRRLALDGGVAEHGIVGGEGRAEREERNERDAVLDAGVEHRLRRPVDEVVGVLHADDLGAIQRDRQMVERDAAQPDSADEAFVAGLDHRGELTVEQLAVDCGRRVRDPRRRRARAG